MSDTPLPDPLDEQASDLLDAGDDAPVDETDVGARLDELRTLRAAMADVPDPGPEVRERSVAAALAAFDDLLLGASDPPAETETETETVPVTDLTSRVSRRPSRARRWYPVVASAAAVVVVLLGIAALVGRSDEQGTSGAASQAGKAAENASDLGGASSAAGAATTVSASQAGFNAGPAADDTAGGGAATTAAAGLAPSVPAASTAAASAGVDETTSTIDRRDVTTTVAAPSTAREPSTTTTTVDPTVLAYLGEFSTTDALAAVLRQPPPVDPTDEGRAIRTQLAEGSCDVVPFGVPIGVLRWNGRDAVAVRSAEAPVVQVIPLDGCNPVALLGASA